MFNNKAKISVVVLGIILVFCIVGAFYESDKYHEVVESEVGITLSVPSDTLRVWYADESLSDYMASMALAFYEKTNIRVIPTLTSGVEYLERIYTASIAQSDYPDLYIATNDTLEKAYLAGIAIEIKDSESLVTTETYPSSALYAVTYHDKVIGYPLSFETSVFVYNKTYMADIARNVIKLEEYAKMLEEDASAEYVVEEPSDSVVLAKANEIVPMTFSDILGLANLYDAPEQVEAFFEWDASDVFYNYFFIGNSMNIGGLSGDDITQIEIYNQEAITSLQMYQRMQEFFSIDTTETTYTSVVEDFVQGKIVFMIGGTDIVSIMEEAQKSGEFAYEYEVTVLPDINDKIPAQSMSVTNAVVVNGLSEKQDLANELARFIAIEHSEKLYGLSGKIPAKKNIAYENPQINNTLSEYERSVPITKMIELSNFWIQLEACMMRVWALENVEEQLRLLSEQIMTQVTGEPYVQEKLYSDEPVANLEIE